MELKKPIAETQKYPVRTLSIVRRIFADELSKHRGKTKDQCLAWLKENDLMGLLPEHLK